MKTHLGRLSGTDDDEPGEAPRNAARIGPVLTSRVGWLCEGSSAARLLVDYDGSPGTPQEARSVIVLSQEVIAQVVSSRQGVLLQFDDGRADRPIITGLIQPQSSLLDELLDEPKLGAPERGFTRATGVASVRGPSPSQATSCPAPRPPEARVDGKRVVLEGTEEVVLKCGEASITLKKDGKVILKGAYIETRSKGLNRIKGASVKIN